MASPTSYFQSEIKEVKRIFRCSTFSVFNKKKTKQ